MASVSKKVALLVAIIFPLSFFLAGCGISSKPDSKSINMVCAFVEGYLENKALALKDLAEGGSAQESVNYFFSPLLNEFDADLGSKELFKDYFDAMDTWGLSVDLAYAQSNKEAITNAAMALETEIDPIAIRCENFGWRFKNGWRL